MVRLRVTFAQSVCLGHISSKLSQLHGFIVVRLHWELHLMCHLKPSPSWCSCPLLSSLLVSSYFRTNAARLAHLCFPMAHSSDSWYLRLISLFLLVSLSSLTLARCPHAFRTIRKSKAMPPCPSPQLISPPQWQ